MSEIFGADYAAGLDFLGAAKPGKSAAPRSGKPGSGSTKLKAAAQRAINSGNKLAKRHKAGKTLAALGNKNLQRATKNLAATQQGELKKASAVLNKAASAVKQPSKVVARAALTSKSKVKIHGVFSSAGTPEEIQDAKDEAEAQITDAATNAGDLMSTLQDLVDQLQAQPAVGSKAYGYGAAAQQSANTGASHFDR